MGAYSIDKAMIHGSSGTEGVGVRFHHATENGA